MAPSPSRTAPELLPRMARLVRLLMQLRFVLTFTALLMLPGNASHWPPSSSPYSSQP